MNIWRQRWLRYRHLQRKYLWLARAGKFGQAELVMLHVYCYEDCLGLPSTKHEDP